MRRGIAVTVVVALVISTVGTAPIMGLQTDSSGDTSIQEQQSGQTSGQVLGEPDISLGTSQSKFSPGTTTEFQLTLINRGEIDRAGPAQYEERVTTARGTTMSIRDDQTPFEVNTGTIAIGNVPTGTVQSGPISITVPESVSPGTYEIPVEYEYDYTRIVSYDSSGAKYNDFTAQKQGTITIRVRDQAQFRVVSQNAMGQVGDTSDISVTVENIGTQPATDASVTVASQSDELTFGTGSGSSTAFAADSWQPGEQRTVNYSVALAEDATQRAYTLDLTVGYTDTDGIAQSSRTLNVGVPTRAAQSFEIRNVQSSLRVNREGRLTATVMNEGPQAIANPVATLSASNQNIDINSPEYALSDLAPGEHATVNYSVDVSSSADAGVQQFSVQLAYDNQGGDRRTSDPLQVNAPINQQVDRFSIEPVNRTAVAGQTSELSLRITNNGEEPLTNIEGQAFLDDPLSSSDDEVFIDRLEPGETVTVSIELSVGSGALEKTYPFSMDFQYETPDGDTKVSKTYNVPIQTTQVEQSGGLPLPLLGGLLVVIVAVGIVWYVRR